jgi:hypothetical protein
VARVTESFYSRAFGLTWLADLPLPRFRELDDTPRVADVRIARVESLPARAGGARINRGWIYDDGIRFAWEDEVAFDMRSGDRVDYAPGPGWSGALPDAFYSTVAALTLSWRALLPFHASTVTIDGRAVLIAGPAGAGKSTLAAALTALGARWLADDLSAVSRDASGRFHAHMGRTVARLHAPVCSWIAAEAEERWQHNATEVACPPHHRKHAYCPQDKQTKGKCSKGRCQEKRQNALRQKHDARNCTLKHEVRA